MAKVNFEIGVEVAFDMTDPYSDLEVEEGYMLHIIDGTEDKQFLERCYIFSEETMNRLR